MAHSSCIRAAAPVLQGWTSNALAAILAQQQGCSVEHVGHFVHGQQHDAIGREGSQQARREALVEPSGAALRPQLLRQKTEVSAPLLPQVRLIITNFNSTRPASAPYQRLLQLIH